MKFQPMNAWFLLHFLLGLFGSVNAQYTQFWEVDGQLRNFGYDFGVGKTKRFLGSDYSELYGVRMGNIQHPKEIYVVNQNLPASEPFVMDKVNRVWVLRPYYGKGIQIRDRKSRYDLGIRLDGEVSFSMAYSWPIYIWYYRSGLPFELVDEVRYKPDQQAIQLIGGESSFFKGFRQGTWLPGIGIRGAISIEWGSYKDISNTLSLGVMSDYFVQEIPLLYSLEKNPQFLPALFINFALGFGSEHP
jgi:hypothetical protein